MSSYPSTSHRPPREIILKRLALISILSMLLLLSCAYYNTFYNAKKQFKKAEESLAANPTGTGPSGSQIDLYEQAIKKASKVLTFYPNSKYADDALFLMGKSYFRMEEWGRARRKFEELLANFPKSEFRWETYYLLGTVQFYMNDRTKARDALDVVMDAQKKNPWADDARFLMGEIAYYADDYKTAAKEYAKIPEVYPKSELKAEAMFMAGECQYKLGNYQEALAAFQKASEYGLKVERRYENALRIGECRLQLLEYQEALEIFERLARSDLYVDRLPGTQLKISEVHYLMGDTAQAIQEYEDIVKKNPKSKAAALAYYRLGLIHMEDFDDLAKAGDYFQKSRNELPSSEAAGLASLRLSQIKKLEEYKQKVAVSDSLQDAEARFALAEIYLLDFNQPDSALAHYQKVIELTPLSKYASRSAYVAAWIVENIVGDTARSQSMYEDLIASYPFSESANAARERLGWPAAVDTSGENAAQRLRQAEELLLKEKDVNGALAQYQSIVTDFPGSPYAPKAECAIAWTLEHLKSDPDSAMAVFKALAQKYPHSECALLAQRKLASLPAEAPEDTTAGVPEDTTAQAPKDTTIQISPAGEPKEKMDEIPSAGEKEEPDKVELEP